MTKTCHAFRGMCRNRPAPIFCQLSHRSTVPTMPWHYHVTMLSVPTILTCHRFDSTIIPQCHHYMMPSFHSITKPASQQSQGMPFQRTPFRQGNGSDVDSMVPWNNSDYSIRGLFHPWNVSYFGSMREWTVVYFGGIVGTIPWGFFIHGNDSWLVWWNDPYFHTDMIFDWHDGTIHTSILTWFLTGMMERSMLTWCHTFMDIYVRSERPS